MPYAYAGSSSSAALKYAQKANTLTHGANPDVLRVLALAYKKNGNLPQARVSVEKLLSLLPPVKPGHKTTELRKTVESLQNQLSR